MKQRNHPREETRSNRRNLNREYKVFVSTWNVGGVLPRTDLKLDDWLDAGNDYDVYVLGFQEAAPLTPKNVIFREKRPCSRWNSLIKTALNRSSSSTSSASASASASSASSASSSFSSTGEKQKIYPVKDGSVCSSPQFFCVASKQMVGIFISVWVRATLKRRLRHLNISSVGCGVMGFMGNKGSISVSFFLHGTSFCFICCHLASGGKDIDERRRNRDARRIFSRTIFRRRKILDHDRIILLGDLNYRISMPEAMARSLAGKKDWAGLLQRDQLMGQIAGGGAFEGWQEGPICFLPTYKYYPDSDEYYGRKGEKSRAPAW